MGEDLFRQRPDGKYVVADVLSTSVALGSSEGSTVIALAVEVSYDDIQSSIQLAVPPEVAGPLALQLLDAATELGFVPSGEVTRTDLPPK